MDGLPPLKVAKVFLVDGLIIEGELSKDILLVGLAMGQEGEVVFGYFVDHSIGAEVCAEGIGFGCSHDQNLNNTFIYLIC